MYDSFDGSAAGSLLHRRKLKSDRASSFTASYGVRYGFLADVERPLPPGVRDERAWKRVPASFELCVQGDWHRVSGDVSGGGVLFLYPEQVPPGPVEVRIKIPRAKAEWALTGTIVDCDERHGRFGHHVKFADLRSAAELDERIAEHVDPLTRRLNTSAE